MLVGAKTGHSNPTLSASHYETYANYRISRPSFAELFNRKAMAVTVAPLFSLSSQVIKLICGYLKDASFASLLEERYRKDPKMLSSFWTGRQCDY
jgi:hypothetical protein